MSQRREEILVEWPVGTGDGVASGAIRVEPDALFPWVGQFDESVGQLDAANE